MKLKTPTSVLSIRPTSRHSVAVIFLSQILSTNLRMSDFLEFEGRIRNFGLQPLKSSHNKKNIRVVIYRYYSLRKFSTSL